MKTGVKLITEERQRQIEVEGWTAEHDAEHVTGDLALASISYVLDYIESWRGTLDGSRVALDFWPWDMQWWKPTPDDPVRQLVKAGALIAAEIDKLQRQRSVEK